MSLLLLLVDVVWNVNVCHHGGPSATIAFSPGDHGGRGRAE